MADVTPTQSAPNVTRIWLTHYTKWMKIDALRRQFRDVEVVFDRSVFPDNSDERMPMMSKVAADMAEVFKPESDGLALGGDPIAIAVCVHALSLVHKEYWLYKYDARYDTYYPVKLGDRSEHGKDSSDGEARG